MLTLLNHCIFQIWSETPSEDGKVCWSHRLPHAVAAHNSAWQSGTAHKQFAVLGNLHSCVDRTTAYRHHATAWVAPPAISTVKLQRNLRMLLHVMESCTILNCLLSNYVDWIGLNREIDPIPNRRAWSSLLHGRSVSTLRQSFSCFSIGATPYNHSVLVLSLLARYISMIWIQENLSERTLCPLKYRPFSKSDKERIPSLFHHIANKFKRTIWMPPVNKLRHFMSAIIITHNLY